MIYHSGIFYPEDNEELLALVSPIGNEERHKAFILPHMRLEYIAALYRTAFASIPDGTRIVLLLPLHREVLEKDKGKKLFSSKTRKEETALGSVNILSLGFDDAGPYEEEEYSLELFYPFIAFHNPSSTLCPLFTRLENSEDVKMLAKYLFTLDDGNTIFITSSNMTDKLPEDAVSPERDKVVHMLENGEHLMDEWRKGHIRGCGIPLIESISRICGNGKWKLIGISEKETKAGHAALYID